MYNIKSEVQVSVYCSFKTLHDYVHDISHNVPLMHIRPIVSCMSESCNDCNKQRDSRRDRAESPQRLVSQLSVSLPEVDELQSLNATGRNDFLGCSVMQCGGNSLLLQVLLCVTSTSRRGWESLSMILRSWRSILLADTTTKGSSSTPRTQPAFLISLLILLPLTAFTLLPQHTAARKISLATTDR